MLRGLLRAKAVGNRQSPMQTIGKLCAALSQTKHIPLAIAFAVTAGAVTALNKIPQTENDKLKQQGKDIKIRPIKTVAKTTTRSEACKKVIKTLLPTQYGHSNASGMDKMARLCTAAYKAGKVVQTDDAVNAFNSVSRIGLRGRITARWPEAQPFFDVYYGLRSPVLYSYTDAKGQPSIKVMWSTEGARMGCVLGSLAFDLADFIYYPLASEFPEVI